MEAVAIIMFHAGDKVVPWIFDEIVRMGGNMELHEWLGTTIKQDGVEMSGMVWLFYRWAEGGEGALEGVPNSSADGWMF